MNKLDLFLMASQNLWRRKLRSFLTVLGVMIGTSSIVIMLSLGFGMSKANEEQIASWGSLTTIDVHKSYDPNPSSKKAKLNKAGVESLKKIQHVQAVNAIQEVSGKAVIGKNEAQASIIGVEPEVMELFDFKVEEGRLFNPSDKGTVIFGGNMPENFFNPKSHDYNPAKVDLMKDRIKLLVGEDEDNYKEYKVKTVGILSSDNFETSYGIYVPKKDLDKMIKDQKKSSKNSASDRSKEDEFSSIKVKVDDMNNVEKVTSEIKDLGYEAYSLTEQLNSSKQFGAVIQAVLGGIGAISLLVAAIGITNTMIMSIYERTKEIGVMKVIGASIKDIRRLFLLEAGLIGFIGGLVGLIFSYLVSFLLNSFAGSFMAGMNMEGSKISIIPISLSLGAMLFSIAIGLLAGYFPAKRAMNLSALEAIKTE